MAKFKTTHIVTLGGDQVGEGSEDAKGCIKVRLLPMRHLRWDDGFDIWLRPVVSNQNKATRDKK